MIKSVELPATNSVNMRYWPTSAPSHIRFYVPNPFDTAPLVGHIFFRERRDMVQIDEDRVENALDEAKAYYSHLGRMLWGNLWEALEDASIRHSGRYMLPDYCGYSLGNYKRSDGCRLPRIIMFGVALDKGELVYNSYYLDVDSHLSLGDVRSLLKEWVADKEPVSWSSVKEEVLKRSIEERLAHLLTNDAVEDNRGWVFTGREASKITMLVNELTMDSTGMVIYEKLEQIKDWLLENNCSITYTSSSNKKIGWLITPKGKISFGYRG